MGFYEGKNCLQPPLAHRVRCLFEPVKRRNAWPFLHTIRRPRIYFYRLQKAAFYYDLILYLYLFAYYSGVPFPTLSSILLLLLFIFHFSSDHIIIYILRFKVKKNKKVTVFFLILKMFQSLYITYMPLLNALKLFYHVFFFSPD